MDCPTFRRQHLEYLDLSLSADAHTAMQAHADACASCSQLDVTLRRGLLVARSLRQIAPSAGFYARLRRKLARERNVPFAAAGRGFARASMPSYRVLVS